MLLLGRRWQALGGRGVVEGPCTPRAPRVLLPWGRGTQRSWAWGSQSQLGDTDTRQSQPPKLSKPGATGEGPGCWSQLAGWHTRS